MKKMILSLVAAMMAATATFAQSSLLATLSHDGTLSTYYGASALKEAYTAAEDGDVITLSSGTFSAVDISKALTIRGAGMQVDGTTNNYPTIIAGDFSINIPETVEQRLTMEGLYNNFTITVIGTLKNASFLKSRFAYIVPSSEEARIMNLTLIHCKISGGLYLPEESSASCVNSYVYGACSISESSSNFDFTNCFVKNGETSINIGNNTYYSYMHCIKNSTFNNCIIHNSYFTTDAISPTCTAYYCVGFWNNGHGIFRNIPNTTNTYLGGDNKLSSLFKTYTGTYGDNETFELNDEAKMTYKGSDGTEVGIYGGNLPFNPTPSNPQITKCNVASKSTADGKLSVDIEVSAAE